MTTLDDLLAELSEVLVALAEAGDPEPETRAELELRRDQLRQSLRAIDIDAHRPTAELLEERARLETRLEAARRERVKKIPGKYLGATQTVGGGVVPAEINRMIDDGNRFDELLDRFEHLSGILKSRGAL